MVEDDEGGGGGSECQAGQKGITIGCGVCWKRIVDETLVGVEAAWCEKVVAGLQTLTRVSK